MNSESLQIQKRPIKWKQLICRMLVWLTLEVWFNVIGLDDIADCGEFIFERPHLMINYTIATLSVEKDF